jgi:hypothetical protein
VKHLTLVIHVQVQRRPTSRNPIDALQKAFGSTMIHPGQEVSTDIYLSTLPSSPFELSPPVATTDLAESTLLCCHPTEMPVNEIDETMARC